MYAQLLSGEMGELTKAKVHYLKAIELEPTICDHHYWFATHLRDDYRDYEGAERHYLECLEMDSSDAGINGSYGYLLYLMKRFEKAKKHLAVALNQQGQTVSIWSFYYNSLVHRALGDGEEADRWMLEAVTHCLASKEVFKKCFDRIKAADPEHMKYHAQFERLVAMKLNALEKSQGEQEAKCHVCQCVFVR